MILYKFKQWKEETNSLFSVNYYNKVFQISLYKQYNKV